MLRLIALIRRWWDNWWDVDSLQLLERLYDQLLPDQQAEIDRMIVKWSEENQRAGRGRRES